MDVKLIDKKLSLQKGDETLMLAYAQGDASAFDQLYARHKVAVYRFFTRQNLPVAVSEELAHDTWLKVINARESYSAKAKFTTYLFTIARHLIIDFQQKKSNKYEVVELIDETTSSDISLALSSDVIEVNHKKQTLNLVIREQVLLLSFEQREVFLLKQESGFSIEDIANITQQNKEKVKSCWRYALQKVRKGLSAYV